MSAVLVVEIINIWRVDCLQVGAGVMAADWMPVWVLIFDEFCLMPDFVIPGCVPGRIPFVDLAVHQPAHVERSVTRDNVFEVSVFTVACFKALPPLLTILWEPAQC